ncbi:laminin G domain-containing protein [Streptomyces sp. NPDC001792]|uniref:laminin G domain-containing protein n=1 Tax=Streptomyces sp. NPDC001792 TaxID=3154524 RepID=UPI00332E1BE2
MTVPVGFPLDDGPLIATWPRVLVQIAWTAGGNSTAPNHWYTVSKRLRGGWKATLAGRQYELDTVTSGSMTFRLDNLDGAFDPDNTSSPYYPYVLPYRRCRLVMMTTPSQNLLYPWVADGTKTLSMAATVGTLGTATGLSPSIAGLTTAQTWAIPNGTAAFAAVGLSGDIQSWSVHDAEGTTVTPGASYSFGLDVQLAPGGMTSLDLKARIGFYDLNGNLLTRGIGNVVSVTTAWTRLTMTRTAPAGAAFAIVSLSTNIATTAATTVRTTGWQLEQGAASTTWASAGTWSQLWQGFVERWPMSYDQGGKYGLVDITAVDALAPLSQLTLQGVMPAWLASTAPQFWFDLASTGTSPDVVGGTAFLDDGGSGAALDIVGANYATNVSITSTTDLGTLWNVPGPVASLLSNQAASLGNSSGATYLEPWDGTDNLMLPASGGWTRMICFRTPNQPGTGGRYTVATLFAATNTGFGSGSGSAQDGAYLFINSNGNVGMNVQTGSGTSLVVVNPSINVCDGNWHCAIASLSADGKTVTVTVDNTGWLNTGSGDQHGTYTQDTIGTLLVGGSVNTQPFNGDLAYFAQWNSELPNSTRDTLARGFAMGWAGDGVSTRVQNILTISGFHPGAGSNFNFFGSVGVMGSVATAGQSPLQIIQTAADTENGQFAVDRFGTPTLYGHVWRWIQSTPVATFGENVAGGEIPTKEDIQFEQDPAHLYNDAQITCDGAVDGTDGNVLQEAQDTASQTAYFPQTLTRQINAKFVATGKGIANYLVSQYKDPHTRVGQITVDLAHSPALQAQVATLKFSDLVRVKKDPVLAPAKQLDGFIEQLEWSGDDTGAALQLKLQVSPASQYRYWMISAAWAALSAGIAAGVSVVTVGPISGNNAIAAQYVIPSGFQMTLGYGTANAETVTVQSVQTVTAGYSTVQLTLAAATTKSHSSGDLICTPLGSISLPPGGTYPSCFDGAAAFGGTSPLIGYG